MTMGLYNSVVRAEHLVQSVTNGVSSYSWQAYGDSRDYIKCRLDLIFIRLGKDAPPAIEAGRAPDRVGTFFGDFSCGLRAGDRIVVTKGPVTGSTFEVRAIPDIAQNYASAHHMEVQIIETNQQLAKVFPSEEGGDFS